MWTARLVVLHSLLALLPLVFAHDGRFKKEKCKSPTSFSLEACERTRNIPEYKIKPSKAKSHPVYPNTAFTIADSKPAPAGFKSSFSTLLATIPMKGLKSCNAGCLFVSTTEGFIPQMKLYRVASSGNEFNAVSGHSQEDGQKFWYPIEQDEDYLIEVGLDQQITMPVSFPYSKTGDFLVVFTGSLSSLLGYFKNEIIIGDNSGWTGPVPVNKEGAAFMVHSKSPGAAPFSAGSLTLALTPYYNRKTESITLHYSNGSTYGGCRPRATRFAFRCMEKKRDETVFPTDEAAQRCSYDGEAQSRNVCTLVRFLDSMYKN
jgi:hypothetical protein